MKSRMEKYNEMPNDYRSNKNKELYKEVGKVDLDQVRIYSNSRVIDNANKQIDIEKIKRYIEKINESDFSDDRKKLNEIKENIKPEEVSFETKDYDINSVLEKARNKREVNYDDLRSQKLNDSFEEVLKKIEKYNKKYKKEEEKEDFNTEEQTLINLINTISINKNEDELFNNLKGSENTQLIEGIGNIINDENFKEEIKAQIDNPFDYHTITNDLDKTIDDVKEELSKTKEMSKIEYDTSTKNNTFYTTQSAFKETDFNQDEDLENECDSRYEDDENISKTKTVCIIISTIIIIAIGIFIVNYVFDLGLF